MLARLSLLLCAILAVVTALPHPQPNGWTQLAAVEDSRLCHFKIALRHAHPMLLDALVRASYTVSDPMSPDYGNYLTVEQIEEAFDADDTDVQLMTKVLNEHGAMVLPPTSLVFPMDSCQDRGDSFDCHFRPSTIKSMFGVEMYWYTAIENGMKKYIIRGDRNYVLPDELKEMVVLVEGLSYLRPVGACYGHPASKNGESVDPGYVGREVLVDLYNITHADAPVDSTVGLIEFNGGGYNDTDVELLEKMNGMPANSVNYSYGPNGGGGIETDLDIESVAMLLPGVKLSFWNYDLWMYEMLSDMAHRSDAPEVMSISYGVAASQTCDVGGCTNEDAERYVMRCELEAAKLVLRGISVYVASGDSGSPSRQNIDCEVPDPSTGLYRINPVFPGSLVHVTTVGATYVESSPAQAHNWTTPLCHSSGCANGTATRNTDNQHTGWASGSHFGIYSSAVRPTWQQWAVEDYLNSGVKLPNGTWNRDSKATPDLAFNGHNCPVVLGGQLGPVDGTSCSAPVAAAVSAHLNSYQKSRGRPVLGHASPLYYFAAGTNAKLFTQGQLNPTWSTETSECGPDFGFAPPPHPTMWSPSVGLGSMNVGLMKSTLDTFAEFELYRESLESTVTTVIRQLRKA